MEREVLGQPQLKAVEIKEIHPVHDRERQYFMETATTAGRQGIPNPDAGKMEKGSTGHAMVVGIRGIRLGCVLSPLQTLKEDPAI